MRMTVRDAHRSCGSPNLLYDQDADTLLQLTQWAASCPAMVMSERRLSSLGWTRPLSQEPLSSFAVMPNGELSFGVLSRVACAHARVLQEFQVLVWAWFGRNR